MITKHKKTLSVWQYLALGYLAVVAIGTLLLCLPFSTASGKSAPFLNALFTSTSATCVTGLVPYDTATHWSGFGQGVILLLIQLGGLGFMTFVTVIFQLIGKNMGVSKSRALMLSSGEDDRADLKRLLRRILLGTLLFEAVGAILLCVRFIPDFGAGKGIWFSVFHSVSAFCNAGFDVMGTQSAKFVSLTAYATDPLVVLTIAGLIVVGGLGFCVWDDVLEKKGKIKNFRLHTKIVLSFTAILLVIPTILFLFFERNTFDGSFFERLLIAFFNAVSPRTAGFNTVDLSKMSDSGYLLTLVLMFVGGAPASTAGGIKLTTFAVIVMGIATEFRGKRDLEIGNRRIESSLVRQALAVFVSCLIIVLTATVAICAIEEANAVATLKAVLFECFSATGTVGLSLGLTPTLSASSKIILILLMFVGRVGILTIGLAFGEKKTTGDLRKPVENVLIG